MITEGHYIEPDRSIDTTPAAHLERTLRPVAPDGTLLRLAATAGEEEQLARLDDDDDGPDDEVA